MPGKYRMTAVQLRGKAVRVYASAKLGDWLREVSTDMTVYQGVRLRQVLEAVYGQGKKDGARRAFEEVDRSLSNVKKEIPHRIPGRPRTHPKKKRR